MTSGRLRPPRGLPRGGRTWYRRRLDSSEGHAAQGKGVSDMNGSRRLVGVARTTLLPALTVGVMLAFGLSALGCSAGAQGATAAVGSVVEGQAVQPVEAITVSGYGEVSAAPDEAVITVSVQNDAADAPQALDQNSKTMAAVIARLKAEGIQDAMIETANVSVLPNTTYDPQTGEQKTQGYRAQNTATVTLKDLSLVAKVFAASIEAGANNVSGPVWKLSENNDATRQSLEKAVAAARSKAEALASAAGVKVGDVLTINESSSPTYPVMYESTKGAADSQVATPPVNPMNVQVSSSVTITYRLSR
jgi:uncharacterized protein